MKTLFTSAPSNRSMPSATVIPVLEYPDVSAASAWLREAFGFEERLRIGSHRIQMAIGEAAIVISRSAQPSATISAYGRSVMVRVLDADHHFKSARAAGAEILNEPKSQPYGERQYTAKDLVGHVWVFSQSLADTEPSTWGGELVASHAA